MQQPIAAADNLPMVLAVEVVTCLKTQLFAKYGNLHARFNIGRSTAMINSEDLPAHRGGAMRPIQDYLLAPRAIAMTNESPTLLYDQLQEIITRRMSIRDLRSDPVPDEYIDKILEAGRWAMSGANSQPWEFMVIRDPEVKKALARAYTHDNNDFIFWMEQMRVPELRHPAFQVGDVTPEEQQERVKSGAKWAEAPVLLVILGDGRRQWGTVQGALSFGRHQSHFTDALSNAAMLMHLAATSLGLASQHVTIHVQEPFKRVLKVPDLLIVHHIVPIGFSAIDRRPTSRRPLKDMVHYDQYDNSKYMSNKDVVNFLYELRGKTMHAYHTKRKTDSGN